MKNVHVLPDPEDPSFAHKKKLLLWYCNNYLVKAAGYEHHGPSIRPYKMASQARRVNGVKKPIPVVSKESEAFGLFLFENCRSKWMHIVPEKVKNKKFEIPKYSKEDNETHKCHKTEWSDKNSGQVKGAGWTPDAFDAFNGCITYIHQLRKADKANGNKIHQYCKDLIREELGITGDKPSSKRKRGETKNPPPKYNEIVELSDDYSVGSESSSGE